MLAGSVRFGYVKGERTLGDATPGVCTTQPGGRGGLEAPPVLRLQEVLREQPRTIPIVVPSEKRRLDQTLAQPICFQVLGRNALQYL